MESVVLCSRYHDRLQKMAQSWLDDHGSIRITHAALSSSNHGHCLTLIGVDGGFSHRRITLLFQGAGLGQDPAAGLAKALVSSQQEAPGPESVGPLTVTREGDKVIVTGLKYWTAFPATDGSAFAFEAADGIWSLDPNGENLRQWVKGDGFRTMIDLTRERLLYLERQDDRLFIRKVEPGKEPVQLGAVDIGQIEQEGGFSTWSWLNGNRLTLAVVNNPLMQVDLTTGAVQTIGSEPLTVLTDILIPTHDGRYFIHKHEHDQEPARIYDLQAGTVAQPKGEYHGYPQLSPVADRYAVLAAESDSGLATGRDGSRLEEGTHIDLGQPDGRVRHLHPPEVLKLFSGPNWSPDGTKLAIQSAGRAWIVDVAAEKWSSLALPADGRLLGWQDGGHLLFAGPGGKLNRLPITGGTSEPLPQVNERVTLSDGTLVYRPNDITGRDSVWVKRPGEQTGVEVLGGDGKYDRLIPMGNSVAVINQKFDAHKLIILTYR